MLHRSLLALALLVVTVACRAPRPVHFSSSPPGAQIVIDGADTGFVTPCMMELASGPTRQVEFALPGYVTEHRVLVPRERHELVFWREAATWSSWNFPMWLGAEDFFLPNKSLSGESPGRLYVRLRREADR